MSYSPCSHSCEIFVLLAIAACSTCAFSPTIFQSPWKLPPTSASAFHRKPQRSWLHSANANTDDTDDADDTDSADEDWRAFRAKLVMNEATALPAEVATAKASAWAYDAGLMVEKGSIVLSRVETTLGCHDLRQPYFCKCVVLIVHHDDDTDDGFTQGIILNRPSNLRLNDQDIVYLDEEGNELWDKDKQAVMNAPSNNKNDDGNSWRMFFGGDISGIYDESPMIMCLHNLTSELARSVSDQILPGVYLTSHLSARSLVETGQATCDSFYTFYGFCGWDPGQLAREVQRESWCMISTDPATLWDNLEQLRHPTYDPRSCGLEVWADIMHKVRKPDETEDDEHNSSNNQFPELMLKEWVTQMLLQDESSAATNKTEASIGANTEVGNEPTFIQDSDIYRALKAASQVEAIPSGALLYASASEVSPFLLNDQFLHKSIILVLQESSEESIGVALNLPSVEVFLIEISDGRSVEFPIRYGGPNGRVNPSSSSSSMSLENDKFDEEQPILWFHSNALLKRNKIGRPMADSPNCLIWSCTFEQVLQALNDKVAASSDFLAVKGFCVWEKHDEGSAGGIMGQLMDGSFDLISRPDNKIVHDVWTKLSNQERLDEDSFYSNSKISVDAWCAAASEEHPKLPSRSVFKTNISVQDLADDALRAWMTIFLLGDVEY